MARFSFRAARTAYRIEGHRVLDHVAVVEADGRVSEAAGFRERLAARLAAPDASPQVLVVVHGRGPEPRRFIARRRWLRYLEIGYGVTGFLLHWPSWRGPMGWPEAEARDAGHVLDQLLLTADAARPDLPPATTLALMTHSMGAYVLASAAHLPAFAAAHPALDTVLVHAPAVPLAGHVGWARRLQARQGVYVIVNDRDLVLHNARALRAARDPRLGASGRALRLGLTPLAEGVTYIDATLAGTRHAYFLPSIRRALPGLYALQRQIIRGGAPDLAGSGAVRLPVAGSCWSLMTPVQVRRAPVD